MSYLAWLDPVNVVDGLQGSPDAGILAAVYWTVSGTTVTVVGQKNVASVVRNATGRYRVTFTSALADTNYGLIVNGRRISNTSNTVSRPGPSRNSTSGWNTYATTTLDIDVSTQGGSGAEDAPEIGLIVFDPSAVDSSQYLAAACWRLSGSTLTLQKQMNVASMSRLSIGVYSANFNTALPDADYSMFGSSRAQDFTNLTNFLFGGGRHSGTPSNVYSTTQLDMSTGLNGGSLTSFEASRGSLLVKDGAAAPRGTVGSVRFTVSGGVVTLIDQWNVASVSRVSAGLFTVNFSEPIIDTNYICFGTGKFADFTNDGVPCVSLSNGTVTPHNTKTTTEADISVGSPSSSTMNDPLACNLWFVKPWLM